MQPSLLVIDDFLPDPHKVRDEVVKSTFGDQIGPDGEVYSGISLHQVEGISDLISAAIGLPIDVKMQFFRLNLDKELPHCWIHADNICANYAAVLYLNEPHQCFGGTAFWTHKVLNIDQMPVELPADVDRRQFEDLFGTEWRHRDSWAQSGFVGMKFNRFVCYPTRMFHSRFPFEGFGAGPEDGRLIFVCFFNVLE